MDQAEDSSRFRQRLAPWAWALIAVAVTAATFLGYGQAELVFQAANLRYCN